MYFFVDLNDEAKQVEVGAKISDELTGSFDGAKLYVAGYAPINAAINGAISSDLATAESIAIPLTMVLLLFVFGSLISAGLPMMVGGLAILGSFFFIWVSTQLTDTSVFALNLITGMGLGLGIDYALLIVNRFREERKLGTDVSEAVRRTMATAGRTVLFSGLTVAIVLGAMLFFPQYFLKSFAIGGVVVVILAVAGALIALPALLHLMGDRINKLRVIRGDLSPKDSGAWSSIARFVMRRPLPILLVTMIALGGLMSLSGSVVFGQVDDFISALAHGGLDPGFKTPLGRVAHGPLKMSQGPGQVIRHITAEQRTHQRTDNQRNLAPGPAVIVGGMGGLDRQRQPFLTDD